MGRGRYKGRSCSGILDWYFLVDSLGEASGLYRFDPFCSEKLAFNAMAGIMGEIGLLLAGWYRRTRQTGCYGGGVEGSAVAGSG